MQNLGKYLQNRAQYCYTLGIGFLSEFLKGEL